MIVVCCENMLSVSKRVGFLAGGLGCVFEGIENWGGGGVVCVI